MFMHIVTQLSGRLMALYTQVLGWLKALLCKLVSNLRVNFIQGFQNAVSLWFQLVQTVLSINRFRANLITAGQLIKAGLTTVKAKVIQIGLQLLTTVRQISQLVRQALLQIKDKLVECIKLVQLRLKEIGCALIHMVRPLTQIGMRFQGLVSQLQQRATQAFKKDK